MKWVNTSTAFTFNLLEESLWTYSIIVNAPPAADDDTLSVVVVFTATSAVLLQIQLSRQQYILPLEFRNQSVPCSCFVYEMNCQAQGFHYLNVTILRPFYKNKKLIQF